MIKGALTFLHINPVKGNSRKQPMDNKGFLKNTTSSLPMSKGQVKVVLDRNSMLQPSVVRSLEMEMDKTKSPEQLTLVQKKKTRRRNRKKKPIVLQNATLVQERSDVDCLTTDNHMSAIFSSLSLYNEGNIKAAVNSSGVLNTINEANAAIFRTSFPRLPLSQSRKKLLVLDINGLLADIVSPPPKEHKADTKISRRAIFCRPSCRDFLRFCFERFEVGVWSSRSEKIASRVIDYLMGDMKRNLLFSWDLSRCTATGFRTLENRHKTLVFKELRRLWEKHDPNLPWEKGEYNETNTLLLDDSPYKALLNPAYTAVFPHSYNFQDGNDSSLGAGGDLRVYLEELSAAEDVQKFVELNPFGQGPITESNESWDFYLKVLSAIYSFPSTI
ncbi:FCP1 domain containing protein [Trema orientale]|uniref:Mitochondrial import inner membrane translocase subunit TIM50 n=1 Tax=Trema orientale TaxID=63057 RepID=A0A2P5DK12_TREOI|nr:FCP1 domain containing protein [Trema orientale]